MFRLLILSLLLGYLSTCLAQELDLTPEPTGELKTKFLFPRFNSTGPGPEDYQCISERSADYYGIGVRLGVYFTWWTAWAASAGMPEEVSTALDQNTVFLFANVVALVRCTITFMLTQLDTLILMHLAMGSIIGVMSTWGYRTCRYKADGVSAMKNFGGVGTHLRVLLNLAACVYGVWFWLRGIVPGNVDLRNDTDQCRIVWTFMFTKVDAAGPIRIFYIVMSILWVIHFGITLLTAPIADYIRLREISRINFPIGNELPKDLWLATGFNYKQLRLIFQTLRIFTFFWLLWSMVTIEMTLTYNHVKNILGPGGRVYFPSQLIPMILGGFTFTRLIWKKLVHWRQAGMSDGPPVADVEPSTSLSPPTQHPESEKLQRVSTTKNLMTLMTPQSPMLKKQEKPKIDPEELDARMQGVDPFWRMLVSYLPWLSLLSRFKHANNRARTPVNQDPEIAVYEPANDPQNHEFWDTETPSVSPDPRGDGTFRDATNMTSRSSLFSSPFSRRRDRYTIDRFENTIS